MASMAMRHDTGGGAGAAAARAILVAPKGMGSSAYAQQQQPQPAPHGYLHPAQAPQHARARVSRVAHPSSSHEAAHAPLQLLAHSHSAAATAGARQMEGTSTIPLGVPELVARRTPPAGTITVTVAPPSRDGGGVARHHYLDKSEPIGPADPALSAMTTATGSAGIRSLLGLRNFNE